MASIVRSSPIIRPSCSLQYLRRCQIRSLSTSQHRSAQSSEQVDVMRNMPKQKSMASRMKNMKRSEIPNDLGLIPATYIRPCGDLPSWISSPMLRAKLEWLYVKQRTLDFMNYVYLNRWNRPKDPITGRRKVRALRLREREEAAAHLHKLLNTALAEGDITVLKKIATSGLVNQQESRINRARMEGVPPATWQVKYRGLVVNSFLRFTFQSLVPSFLKSFHVLADRQISVPVGPGLTLRQVVLRVDSTQKLDKNDGSAPVTKTLREYFVIQQSTIGDEQPEDWKVWGTTKPTDTEAAKEIISHSKNENGSITDRMRALMPGL